MAPSGCRIAAIPARSRAVALVVPECVQHTHERRSLPDVIVQVEQLKPTQPPGVRRLASILLLVARKLKLSRRQREVAVLRQQPLRRCRIAEDLVNSPAA